MRYIEEVEGVASPDELRRGLRIGAMIALGISPQTAAGADDIRLQSIIWDDDAAFRIRLVHDTLWQPREITVHTPEGDMSYHIQTLFGPDETP